MQARTVDPSDLPAIAELARRWEAAWFGAPERTEDEVRESFELAEASRLLVDDGRIVAAAWSWGTESVLTVDPDVASDPIYSDLLAWLAVRPGMAIEALSQDEPLRRALARAGWQHTHSAFELMRPITPDWVIAEPEWPTGVTIRDLQPDDAESIYRLIYVDAGWAEIPGHHERDIDEWRSIFLTDQTLPEQQVLAWRGDRLAGIAMGRTFGDGTGWISQLAVAKAERGHGLGRALLLEALRRRRAGGATSLGLSVSEMNRGALGLYLGVGLVIQREWMAYERP